MLVLMTFISPYNGGWSSCGTTFCPFAFMLGVFMLAVGKVVAVPKFGAGVLDAPPKLPPPKLGLVLAGVVAPKPLAPPKPPAAGAPNAEAPLDGELNPFDVPPNPVPCLLLT